MPQTHFWTIWFCSIDVQKAEERKYVAHMHVIVTLIHDQSLQMCVVLELASLNFLFIYNLGSVEGSTGKPYIFGKLMTRGF